MLLKKPLVVKVSQNQSGIYGQNQKYDPFFCLQNGRFRLREIVQILHSEVLVWVSHPCANY